MYYGGIWSIIANEGDVTDSSKYSTSKNSSTGLYYRLHILDVKVSDIKKHRCEAVISGEIQTFFLQLILIGRCYCILVICKCRSEKAVWPGHQQDYIITDYIY